MLKSAAFVIAILLYCTTQAQPNRTDSLTNLITNANDLSEKARLFILRSKAWPNSQTEKTVGRCSTGVS
ncbi:MAG: hypothetical protein WDM90_02955 [Ferruginibacter sp.]